MLFTADLCDKYKTKVSVLNVGLTQYGSNPCCHGLISTIKVGGDVEELKVRLSTQGDNKILIVDTCNSPAAVFGEGMANMALSSGFAGIIILGFVRDSLALSKLNLSVWAFGLRPNRSWEKFKTEQEIDLLVGDLVIKPGATLCCDHDGLIMLPFALDDSP